MQIPTFVTFLSLPASHHPTATKHFDFTTGTIPRNYKINWLLLTTGISLSALSPRRHLVPKTGYVRPEEGRGCSACSRGVSWGHDRQIWHICVAVENNSTVSPCPKFTGCCSSGSDICSRPPRLHACSRSRTCCPFNLSHQVASCDSWDTYPTLLTVEGTTSSYGEGARGELPRFSAGKLIHLGVFYIIKKHTSLLMFRCEHMCLPITERRAAVTLALYIPGGLPQLHGVCWGWCTMVIQHNAAQRRASSKPVTRWELQQHTSVSNGVTDVAPNGLLPKEDTYCSVLLHFPNPSPHSWAVEWCGAPSGQQRGQHGQTFVGQFI